MEIKVKYLTQEKIKIKDSEIYKISVYDSRYDRIIYVWTTKNFNLKNDTEISLIYDYGFDFKKSTYKLKLIDINIIK